MLHGWEGNKTSFESTTPEGDGNETYDYNNIYYAQHGYAVLNYSARGWGNSCGAVESRDGAGCEEGWIRLADQRYEARDTQYLLGLLADEDIAQAEGDRRHRHLIRRRAEHRARLPEEPHPPAQRRIRAMDEPQRDEAMEIKAAFPRWPWSDLVDALEPNGRFLDSEVAPRGQSYEPIGVEIQSYVTGLYRRPGRPRAISPRPGWTRKRTSPKWYALINAGETVRPRSRSNRQPDLRLPPGLRHPRASRRRCCSRAAGPTTCSRSNSRCASTTRCVRMKGYVALMFGDLGHSPASNKENTDQAFNEEGAQFFAAKLEHDGSGAGERSVTAYTQTCPKSAPAGGPYTATSWAKLAPAHAHASAPRPHRRSPPSAATRRSPPNSTRSSENEKKKAGNVCKVKAEIEPDTATTR